MKFHKGDEVKITGGKDKGKTGKIERVFPDLGLVLVPGINMYKRHKKATDPRKPSGILDIVKPMPVGSVAIICPKCHQTTRAGFVFDGDTKTRVCKKCGQKL